MSVFISSHANQLRLELGARNRRHARGRQHVESYGSSPVIVYAPDGEKHGNFFDASYAAIVARSEWMRRFGKIHAQAGRSLPKVERRWRELDSSMSSDALLMNVFCAPGVVESQLLRNALGVEAESAPIFGWRARVPLANARFDRTEVDMRLGSLLVEAKLTETDFQAREAAIVESYRDFGAVFESEMLPRIKLPPKRRKEATEFPENYSQEFESMVDVSERLPVPAFLRTATRNQPLNNSRLSNDSDGTFAYSSYQLIRNVLAAYAENCSFCVIHDARRPDLREEWFHVMAAVKSAAMRVRLKVLTWQELAAFLPNELQAFLDSKYGVVAPGRTPSPIDGIIDTE
jgi:Restriction Endonuclease associating with ARP